MKERLLTQLMILPYSLAITKPSREREEIKCPYLKSGYVEPKINVAQKFDPLSPQTSTRGPALSFPPGAIESREGRGSEQFLPLIEQPPEREGERGGILQLPYSLLPLLSSPLYSECQSVSSQSLSPSSHLGKGRGEVAVAYPERRQHKFCHFFGNLVGLEGI